ncbi:MAG: hypothetical protein QQN49_02635, partial [Nitrosopumilus sp.]
PLKWSQIETSNNYRGRKEMKKIILLIASIIITILGLSLIFIQTEIQMTLLGTILMMLGVFLFLAYILNKGPSTK